MSTAPRPQVSGRVSHLERIRVSDAMHPGAITCTPDAPLRTVAERMAADHIHCVVVPDLSGRGRSDWGVVSDADLIRAAAGGDVDALKAGDIAAAETLTVSDEDSVARAVHLMHEHRVSHLVVVAASSGRPVGVLSSLDVAAVLTSVAPGTPPA